MNYLIHLPSLTKLTQTMKKRMISMAVAAAALGLGTVSCAKDRTCTCTETSTKPGSTSSSYTIIIKGATKGQAKANCVSTTETEDNITYTTDCSLS
jgi:hypothetical protein